MRLDALDEDDLDFDFDEQKEAEKLVSTHKSIANRRPPGDRPSRRLVRRRAARCALRCRRIDGRLFLRGRRRKRTRREPERARAFVRDENAEHRARRRVQSESWMANGVFGEVCETDASGLSISFPQAKSRGSGRRRRNVEEVTERKNVP